MIFCVNTATDVGGARLQFNGSDFEVVIRYRKWVSERVSPQWGDMLSAPDWGT